ncbi:MAG: 3-methyl-2-oxobutanoate hydroxymethyltransferase [bacterium]|nr:3-methyl-2-oxobutanoate hydroxymethyltransferase [bacterium]
MEKKVTTATLMEMKQKGEKITMLTAYDYPISYITEKAGIEVVLIGDSLGNVVLGYDNTLPVTVNDIIYHTKAVVRGNKKSLIVADMPFLSYKISKEEAVRNAGRMIQEGGASAVKVEGGAEISDIISSIIKADIPVMGHLGLTPQAINQFGSYKTRGVDKKEAQKIISDAKELEKLGVFAIVLEKIPLELAKKITASISIPTIGIGAGPFCDGQVLVTYDMLGLFSKFLPKFVKKYADLDKEITNAFLAFSQEVKNGKFPDKDKHSF